MLLTYANDVEAVNALSPKERSEFEEWMKALDVEHASLDFPYGKAPLAETTRVDCWLGYFMDGVSPERALDEDMSYD